MNRRHPSLQAPVDANISKGSVAPASWSVEAYIRFFATERWTDHERVLQLFGAMGQYVERLKQNARRARTLSAYIRPFYHLCCAVQPGTGGALIPALDALTRTGCIQAIAYFNDPGGRGVPSAQKASQSLFFRKTRQNEPFYPPNDKNHGNFLKKPVTHPP